MHARVWIITTLSVLSLAACSNHNKMVTITPAIPTMLTSTSQQFSAGGVDVTWSASAGSIDQTEKFTAPNKLGPDIMITATEKTDTSVSSSISVKLATADVGDKHIVADNFSDYPNVWTQAFAASGNAMYATWGNNPDGEIPQMLVASSADGGGTWGTPVVASPAVNVDSGVSCVSAAVDAGDPNIVYVVFNFEQVSCF